MPAQVIVAALAGGLVGIVLAGYLFVWLAWQQAIRDRNRFQDQTINLRGELVEKNRALDEQQRELDNLKRVAGSRLYRDRLEDVGFAASQAALLVAQAEVDLANAKRILRGEAGK